MYTQPVQQITVDSDGKATGVALKDGTEIKARVVLSNATPKVTYLDLLEKVRGLGFLFRNTSFCKFEVLRLIPGQFVRINLSDLTIPVQRSFTLAQALVTQICAVV